MEVVICSDKQQIGQVAANQILRWVGGLTTPALGLITGSSPLALYNELARRVGEGEINFSYGIGSTLDKCVGTDLENLFGYRQTTLCTVVKPLCIDPTRVRASNSSASDLAAAALEYDRTIAATGSVDVQVLGTDNNNHIGFNEPTSSFASRTRVKTLTEQACVNDVRFFGEGEWVPTHCMTQGLEAIMEIRHVVTTATGRYKARVVTAMTEGFVAAVCPASILQLHPSVLVVVNEVTATEPSRANYSRRVVDILI